MINELVNTFTPTNDHGLLDKRFEEDLTMIFKDVRKEVIDGLNEFKQKTTDLENQYGSLAYELCISFIKRMEHIDETERNLPSNQFRWRTKKLRKQLIEGLKERGFKPSNVTKMIGAAEFAYKLYSEGNKKVLEFVEGLGITCVYIVSKMNHAGIQKAMSYEKDNTEWDSKTDTFISKQITQKALEDIKRSYPKNPEESRGKRSSLPSSRLNILDDDPTPITEVVLERSKEDMSQLELIDELVQVASLIDTSKIYKDKDAIERLNVVSESLWSIAHLAKTPIPN